MVRKLRPIGQKQQEAPTVSLGQVGSIVAVIPIMMGLGFYKLILLADLRIWDLLLFVMFSVNLGLAYYWQEIRDSKYTPWILAMVNALQWVFALVSIVLVFMPGALTNDVWAFMLYLIAGFCVILAAIALLHRRVNADGYPRIALPGFGVLIMTTLVWKGVREWTMEVRAHSFQGSSDSAEVSASSNRDLHYELGQKSREAANANDSSKIRINTPINDPLAIQWSYHGERGPEMWGSLDERFKVCNTGEYQSPIDIPKRSAQVSGDIRWLNGNEKATLFPKDLAMLVEFSGKSHFSMAGRSYKLRNMRIHSPSEHFLRGMGYPMEIQFLSEDHNGKPVMVAFLVEIGENHAGIEQITSLLANGENSESSLTLDLKMDFFFRGNSLINRYEGSFTTPPCNEGVLWNVIANPIEISRGQLDILRKRVHYNARPIQPLGAREFALD